MIFLNSIAMIALTALAVPIVIHLRRQRKAKVVDWAAMQFLSHSLVKRRRGLALEHLLLLLCRCLLIVLFVLAMARPQIKYTSDLWWIPALFLGLVGLIALVWAVVSKSKLGKRMMAAAGGLGVIASLVAWATLDNDVLPEWDQPRDVAIVLDVSSSMKLEVEGKSNFNRATEEAALMVDQLPGGSTVCVVSAGPVVTLASPSRANLRQVADELSKLEVIGGGTNLHQAIEQSQKALERSPNKRKQIVVFSDNQLRPWQQAASQVARSLSVKAAKVDSLGELSDETAEEEGIELFCRLLPLPSELRDVAVTDLQFEEGTASIHRPLRIVAELFNGGEENATNLELELLVNDKVVHVESIPQLKRNSHTSVRFQYQVEQPGWSTLAARLKGTDGLASNDILHRVVHVSEELPVLIVNGDSSSQDFERPATFLQLALDPRSFAKDGDAESKRPQLTKATKVDAADIRQVKSFTDYQVVVLCDVPRLPDYEAQRLAEFVEQGGGLWVLPGQRCQSDFYNDWSSGVSGEPVMPMRLVNRAELDPKANNPLELDVDSVSHGTLNPLFETGQHDLSELQVSAYWRLKNWPEVQPTPVAARLTNGDPLMVEHVLGRGRVLATALSFDSLESNFIGRISFPVLTHLWVEHLANSKAVDLNHRPQRNLVIQLDEAEFGAANRLTLEAPGGFERKVNAIDSEDDDQVFVQVGLAAAPGVYHLSGATADGASSVPFTVLSDKDEFDLSAASEDKLAELGEVLQIKWVTELDQIEKIARGSIEQIDLWKFFAVGAMVMLSIEVLVMRWIAWRRCVSDIPGPQQASSVTALLNSTVTELEVATVSRDGESHDSEPVFAGAVK